MRANVPPFYQVHGTEPDPCCEVYRLHARERVRRAAEALDRLAEPARTIRRGSHHYIPRDRLPKS